MLVKQCQHTGRIVESESNRVNHPHPEKTLMRIKKALSSVLVLAFVGGVSPHSNAAEGTGSAANAAPRRTPAEVAATVQAVIDEAADPCVDFYRYACGQWLDTTPLPSDRSRWGRGFNEIADRNLVTLRSILEDPALKSASQKESLKLSQFYGSCMNEAAIDAAGVKPMQPIFRTIESIKDLASLMSALGKLAQLGAPALFSSMIEPDFKNPDKYILYVSQGGLGLPDRSYYLEPSFADKLAAYRSHVAKQLELAGDPAAEASSRADAILAFETEIAKLHWQRERLRDPNKTYNKLNRAGLQQLTPDLPWDSLFKALGYPKLQEISVMTPDVLQGMNTLLTQSDWETVRSYLRWHALRSKAQVLAKPFSDESFNFYGKVLSGQKEQLPRWKRCVQATDDALGEMLGKLYVERSFPGRSKTVALEMIQQIEAAFVAGLGRLSWMDDVTRAAAKKKALAVGNKIGYPDTWLDYSAVKLVPNDYFANSAALNSFALNRRLKRVGGKVDKSEWGMTPPTVNAYYNPLANEMAFPAGIMQPPFFDQDFSVAMNYGAMGMVVGHELTHGFDDEGRKFAADGQLREWWAPEVSAKYEERAQCVRDLYDGYEVQPGLAHNGALTSGENIADLGGLKMAYRAYRKYIAQKPESVTVKLEGLSDEQLFFVAFAQSWCSLQTPEIEQQLIKTDPHAHPRFRVNGSVSQLPEFAQAFRCEAGQPMAPAKRCEVW
jgi:endothelin-converting enzyme/putative endopeptidase